MNAKDTGQVRLPSIPPVDLKDPGANRWAKAVTEWIQVRGGVNGNPFERAVTLREMKAEVAAAPGAFTPRPTQPGEVQLPLGNGLVANISSERFSQIIRQLPLYNDLNKSLNDPSRFEGLAQEVKSVLLRSILDEAAKRGADITRVETQIQEQSRSLAMVVEEITASIAGNDAGIRQMQVAFADENSARADQITQLEASLGNYYQDGTPGRAALETSLSVVADRALGLSAEYMVKLNTGGAVAGFGLSASEDPEGNTESAFIVQADQFALIGTVTFSQGTPPTSTAVGQTWYNTTAKLHYRAAASGASTIGAGAWVLFTPAVPFGVDTTTNTVYINGQLRVNAGGPALEDAASGQGVVKSVSFLRAASQPATPTGGTFAAPTATGWSDGVPADNNQPLWMTTRILTSDGLGPQQATWTTPAKVSTPSTGAKVQFSVDGSTNWHDTPSTNDYYMRSGTSTDNGATWSYGGATKIKGEQGIQGSTGLKGDTGAASTVAGPAGKRGTRQLYATSASYVSGYGFTAAATTLIASATSGSTPTTPIKGDTVTFTNGTNYTYTLTCTADGSNWAPPGVVIDGSLLVTGSITANKVVAEGLRAGTGGQIQATGYPGFALNGVAPSPAGTPLNGAKFGVNSTGYVHTDNLLCWGQIFTPTLGAQASVSSPVILAKNLSNGLGVKGESASGNGGLFVGNATCAPVQLENLGSLPSSKVSGQLCNVNGVLYFSNGSVWKVVNLT